jgi:hypothetical protein
MIIPKPGQRWKVDNGCGHWAILEIVEYESYKRVLCKKVQATKSYNYVPYQYYWCLDCATFLENQDAEH